MTQVEAHQAEILSINSGTDNANGLGVCFITMRIKGDLRPSTIMISRNQLLRLVQDGDWLLQNSKSLNAQNTLKDAEDWVDTTSLPQRYDPAYESDSPLDETLEIENDQ